MVSVGLLTVELKPNSNCVPAMLRLSVRSIMLMLAADAREGTSAHTMIAQNWNLPRCRVVLSSLKRILTLIALLLSENQDFRFGFLATIDCYIQPFPLEPFLSSFPFRSGSCGPALPPPGTKKPRRASFQKISHSPMKVTISGAAIGHF